MCGSGVVIRQATEMGLRGIGFDVDPLAVLMSRVWTCKKSVSDAGVAASEIAARAKLLRLADVRLPSIDCCAETQAFVKNWFALAQRRQLRKISFLLTYKCEHLPSHMRDILWLALSRIIITKHMGASLAWDTSHSRPHKVGNVNDFDVLRMFVRSADWLADAMTAQTVACAGRVNTGDCRNLAAIRSSSIDAVITSPPYLNAIDYLRGHKFSLVWMGHTIPRLREIRAASIGTEVGYRSSQADCSRVFKSIPNVERLPSRQRNILRRYAIDAAIFLDEMHRVLAPNGKLCLVLGDSNIRGQHIANSKLFAYLARQAGFHKASQRRRPLQASRRYLPITSTTKTLENRMRYEVIQTYVAIA
jgi:hypothetical protein